MTQVMSHLDGEGTQRASFDDVNQGYKTITINSFITATYDYISVAYPSSVSETYTYKLGGSGGTTQGTITVTYVDSTKAQLLSVAKS